MNTKISADRLKRIRNTLQQRLERQPEDIVNDIRAHCFPKQLAFIDDTSRRKLAICTRQAAKTFSVGIQMVVRCLTTPNTKCLFVSQTNSKAKEQFLHAVLETLKNTYGFKADVALAAQKLKFVENRSFIKVAGADSSPKDMEKLRGDNWDIICIDEVQSWDHDIDYFVKSILGASAATRGGQIVLMGTPGLIKDTYWHRVSDGRVPGWSRHHWSWQDNTSPTPNGKRVCDNFAEEYQQRCLESPDGKNDPELQREYEGKWVTSSDERVYLVTDAYDKVVALPTDAGARFTVIGADMGFDDPDAIVVMHWHAQDPTVYVSETYEQSGNDANDLGEVLQGFVTRVRPNAIVIDAKNQKTFETIRRHFQIEMIPAEQQGKTQHIRLLNNDVKRGNLILLPAARDAIRDEWNNMVWDPRQKALGAWNVMRGSKDHLSDALLYGWRFIRTQTGGMKKPAKDEAVAPVDSPEVRQVREWEQRRVAQAQRAEQQRVEAEAMWSGFGSSEWDDPWG